MISAKDCSRAWCGRVVYVQLEALSAMEVDKYVMYARCTPASSSCSNISSACSECVKTLSTMCMARHAGHVVLTAANMTV